MENKTNLLPIARKLLTRISKIKLKKLEYSVGFIICPKYGQFIEITIFDEDSYNKTFRFDESLPEEKINKDIEGLIALVKKDDFKEIVNYYKKIEWV